MKIVETEFLNIKENEEYLRIIEKTIKHCKTQEKLNPNIYVNIILTNNVTIKKINKKHRNIDEKTDVLSFPIFEKKEIKKLKNSKIEYVLGDIVLSIPKIKEQSKQYGHSFEREFIFMIVHGFYHLMGYDHMTSKDKTCMREKEEIVLSKMKVMR